MRVKPLFGAALALLLSSLSTVRAADKEIEVLHWWTSGSEAESLKILKSMLAKNGYTWVDSPIIGGGGDKAMTALKTRVVTGNPPAAVQIKGPEIQEWAQRGALAKISDVAHRDTWDKVLPHEVARIHKYKGDYVAVPVNVHRLNWLWINASVLKELKAEPPRTMDEFFALAEKAKQGRYIAVAHGGQPWQDATLFEEVALGIGGPDFVRKALIEFDQATLTGPKMKEVFDAMRRIKGYTDPESLGRSWETTTALVIQGRALMQFMGDWAKGEFNIAGKKANKDFICVPAPGSQDSFSFVTDSFAMFDSKGNPDPKAQNLFASLISHPDFQSAFNLRKGSIPVFPVPAQKRKEFDACAQDAMKAFDSASRKGTLLPSVTHRMAVSPTVVDAVFEVVTKHFHSDMTSEEAVSSLAKAIKGAQM